MMKAYFYSFLKNNKIKVALLVLSIALYFGLAVAAVSLHKSIPEIATIPLRSIGVQTIIQKNGKIPKRMAGAILPHSNAPISKGELDKLKQLAFVEGYDQGIFFWQFDRAIFKAVLGVAADSAIFSDLLKRNILKGEFNISQDNIIITDDFAHKHNISLSDKVELAGSAYNVKGILKASLTGNIVPADIYMDIHQAEAIIRNSEEMKNVYQFPDGEFANVIPLRTDPLWKGDKEREIKAITKEFIVFSEKTFSGEVAKQLSLLSSTGRMLFAVLGGIIIAAFCLMVMFSIKSREKEITLLRMIGWKIGEIKKHFISESLVLLLISVLLGNALAFAALHVVSRQTVTMELPWDISAKPHFLPEENSIERIIQANIPVHYDWLTFTSMTVLFLILFLGINYALFHRLKKIKPSEYGRQA